MNAPINFHPSVQQAAFLDWCANGTGSCVLEAVAGSGKTTTLIEAVRAVPGSVAFMAYNKKVSDEIGNRLKAAGFDWQKAQSGTVHSFGLKAYKKVYPAVAQPGNIRGSKVADILDGAIASGALPVAYKDIAGNMCKLVSLAKQTGLGITANANDIDNWIAIVDHHDIDFGDNVDQTAICEACLYLLSVSNVTRDVIDFDDMIYLPLLLNLRFWQYDNVFLDEAQDTNATRRLMARKMLRPGGRLMAVGDRHQAIYGFTGADNDSLDLIRADFGAIDMPMTKTFRCPKAVVEFARQWVGHIEAVDTAPEGEVTGMRLEAFMENPGAIEGISNAAILCRNVKPMVSLALQLIRRKVACKVEGREIGEQLKKLVRRWKVTTTAQLLAKLEQYRVREIEKATAKKNLPKVALIEDTVETIKCIVEDVNQQGLNTVDAVAAHIDSLFADDVKQMLVLSTIHKSKGREWHDVYWLDRAGLCPSRYAKQPWQLDQERNLMYVAATRAKSRLIELYV